MDSNLVNVLIEASKCKVHPEGAKHQWWAGLSTDYEGLVASLEVTFSSTHDDVSSV